MSRPRGGFTEVTKETLGTGSSPKHDPPGWIGGRHPHHQQRGHLIAQNHGGSGYEEDHNLVTITDGTNNPGMMNVENRITAHVKKDSTEFVLVETRAYYQGNNLLPDRIHIYAIDQDSNVIADDVIPNGLRQKAKCCQYNK